MSFFRELSHTQAAAQNNLTALPAVYQHNLAELLRIRKMENSLRQANKEIEQLKHRLTLLEDAFEKRTPKAIPPIEEYDDSSNASMTSPLPIAELQELAAMARKFR